jgi:molecular chaperone GrpE
MGFPIDEGKSSVDEGYLALESELKKKEEEYRALEEKYIRSLAEMENHKKRMNRDLAESIKFANEKVFVEIIPVVDNLERAIHHAGEKSDFNSLVEGLHLILRDFTGLFDKFCVKSIDSTGQLFDPAIHHAVSQVTSEVHEEGMVIEELRKGYSLNNRTLRPALVCVSKKPALPTGTEEKQGMEK